MYNIEDIKQRYFLDCKKIISELQHIETPNNLLNKKSIIEELYEKLSFLKVLSESPEFSQTTTQIADIQQIESPEIVLQDEELLTETDIITEKIETNKVFAEPELSNFEFVKEDVLVHEKNSVEEQTSENEVLIEEPQLLEEEIIEENSAEELEKEQIEADERRRKIVEFEKQQSQKQEYFEETIESHHKTQEKKFKLAHIKGLKSVQSLFDDDHSEVREERIEQISQGSLLKNNVPTDFMEAEKPKQEFKLDLNDKIAFSKMLFDGSQTELNDAVKELNSFKTLDEAKEYLSELYYDRNWKKADEYAQRLWALVENKFL